MFGTAAYDDFGRDRSLRKVAAQKGLAEDWLNDAAKGYVVGTFKRVDVERFSNLIVWAPEARYMLAMKCISALKLERPEQIFAILQEYYPKR